MFTCVLIGVLFLILGWKCIRIACGAFICALKVIVGK